METGVYEALAPKSGSIEIGMQRDAKVANSTKKSPFGCLDNAPVNPIQKAEEERSTVANSDRDVVVICVNETVESGSHDNPITILIGVVDAEVQQVNNPVTQRKPKDPANKDLIVCRGYKSNSAMDRLHRDDPGARGKGSTFRPSQLNNLVKMPMYQKGPNPVCAHSRGSKDKGLQDIDPRQHPVNPQLSIDWAGTE